MLYETLATDWAAKVLLGVFGALLQAVGAVVAHRAPLSPAEAEAVRADVGALRSFFVADGAGLPEAEVRASSAVLLKAVDASVDDEYDEAQPQLPQRAGAVSPPASRSVASSLSSRLGAYAFGSSPRG